ncbi:MAG: ABC transporter permease [Lachnospiraceae bacterium]|nr:ABC transporter permease [Lachnospiraceae bacterium]
MLHLLRYSILNSARNRITMFWSLLFPIILGFFFHLGFSGANDSEILDSIPTGVVTMDSSHESDGFSIFLEQMDGDTLTLTYFDTEEDAAKALSAKEISGYFINRADRSLIVNGTGLNESILTQIMNCYTQNESMILDIAASHPDKWKDAIASIEGYTTYVEETSLGGQSLDSFITYYFALIGMACLYGCFLGLDKALQLLAYNSPLGARRCVTPTHKLKLIFTDWLAVVILHYINLLILLFVIRFIFHMDLGSRYGMILLIALMGDIIGVSLGFLIGCAIKAKEGIKIGIMIGVTMTFSFAAGLMFSDVKMVIEKHAPLFNRVNPAALISDAFYCISIYDNPERMATCLLILSIMSAALILISFFITRRERYDSI